jgi:restriction endonuclease Mrr
MTKTRRAAASKGKRKMTFTEAAALVLRLVGKPLHYKDITDIAIEKGLLSHVGKSPEVTMGSRLNSLLKKSERENPLKRVKPGVFALRDWSDAQVTEGLADKRPPLECIDPAALEKALAEHVESGASDVEAEEVAAHVPLSDIDVPEDDEEKHRAELSQGASELFAPEEDDDEPIFAPEEEETSADAASDGEGGDRASKRRRRRRRGRGRRDEESDDVSGDDLPAYTVSDAEPEEALVARIDEGGSATLEVPSTELPRDLVKVLEAAFGDFDRSRGPVAASQLADQIRKRSRGESQVSPASLLLAAAAENLKASRSGQGPRFRINGSKLSPMSWYVDRRVDEARRALTRAAENYRAAQSRALCEQLARLPHRALGDLVVLLLERMGAKDITPVRRAGTHGSELHLKATLQLRGVESAWGAMTSAIVVRRDGRDVGREKVLELRGSLHHYGSAGHGWLITSGQVLSGAREEAASSAATPVSLTGRAELAELFLEHGILAQRASLDVVSLDWDLLDLLQNSGGGSAG